MTLQSVFNPFEIKVVLNPMKSLTQTSRNHVTVSVNKAFGKLEFKINKHESKLFG